MLMTAKKQAIKGTTERVLLTIPTDLYAQVQELAKESDISPQHFIKRILTEAAENEVIYPPNSGIFEAPSNYNKRTKSK